MLLSGCTVLLGDNIWCIRCSFVRCGGVLSVVVVSVLTGFRFGCGCGFCGVIFGLGRGVSGVLFFGCVVFGFGFLWWLLGVLVFGFVVFLVGMVCVFFFCLFFFGVGFFYLGVCMVEAFGICLEIRV